MNIFSSATVWTHRQYRVFLFDFEIYLMNPPLSAVDCFSVARIEIATYPVDDVDPLICDLHPALLHVVRIGKGNHLPKPNYITNLYYNFEKVDVKMEIKSLYLS